MSGGTKQWRPIALGFAAVFALFQWAGTSLGSDRGQAGLIVGGLVVAATLALERIWYCRSLKEAALSVGLGTPRRRGMIASGSICLLLLLAVPAFAWLAGASLNLYSGWLRLLPGLFAQAGVAEETLFRGFLFGRLRRGRSFWRAAVVAMIPFFAVHLWLFVTMDWVVAAAAVALSVTTSFPLAHLYELGGRTIWAPALLHFVIQGAAKLFVFSDHAAGAFPIVWMALSMIVPMLVFCVRRQT